MYSPFLLPYLFNPRPPHSFPATPFSFCMPIAYSLLPMTTSFLPCLLLSSSPYLLVFSTLRYSILFLSCLLPLSSCPLPSSQGQKFPYLLLPNPSACLLPSPHSSSFYISTPLFSWILHSFLFYSPLHLYSLHVPPLLLCAYTPYLFMLLSPSLS